MDFGVDTEYGTGIMPGLYRVGWWDSGEQGVVNCDSYAVDCLDKVVLVDAGRGGKSFPALKANLQYWGLWDRLAVCIITHMHLDHAGGIPQLQNEGIRVWAGEAAASFGERPQARTYFNGEVPRIDRALRNGEGFKIGNISFKAFNTPGHTSTGMSYLAEIDSIKCLFAGDMIMPHGTTGYCGSFDFDREKLIDSLTSLSHVDFDALLTGHMLRNSQPEGFWLTNGKARLNATLQAGLAGEWPIPG